MIKPSVAVICVPLLLVILLFGSTGVVRAESFSLTGELSSGVQRLAGEATDLAAKIVDPADGLWGTAATVAAVGLVYGFDDDIKDKLSGIHGSRLDKAADAGSLIGNPFIHLGVAAAVYGGGILADSPKYEELGEMLGEALVMADGVSFLLKEATGRARPLTGAGKDRFRPFQLKTDYDSFPSMHTASSFAMASVLAATTENWGARTLYYAAAGFVGFSRLYQNKHWASDALLGAALGELSGRVVTSFHADKSRKVTLAPMVAGESLGLSLVGRF